MSFELMAPLMFAALVVILAGIAIAQVRRGGAT